MAQLIDNPLIQQSIDSYLSVLVNDRIPISRLYLFGSYAKGTYSKESDIDLAVFWDRGDKGTGTLLRDGVRTGCDSRPNRMMP